MKAKLTLFALLLLLGGCMNGTRGQALPPTSPDGQPGVHVRQTVLEKPPIENPQEVAARLEQLAESIPCVQNARCVVFGNTAIVGIDVEEGLERDRVDVIKYSVAEAFRKDPYGINAYVTTDMDLNRRIAEIREHTQNGRPVAGFAEELADLIGRIVPQMPRDLGPRAEPPAQAQDPRNPGQ